MQSALLLLLVIVSDVQHSNSFINAVSPARSATSFISFLRVSISSEQERNSSSSFEFSSKNIHSICGTKHVSKGVIATMLCSLSLFTFVQPAPVAALSASMAHSTLTTAASNTMVLSSTLTVKTSTDTAIYTQKVINSAFERSRQKRTLAIKDMESKGIIKVETDDSGNQFLSLPWIPNRRVPYKSLSLQQRLQNEVCAGAFGEFCKDLLLHPVDTLKTRRQAAKKKQLTIGGIDDDDVNPKDNNIIADSYEKSQPIITSGLNTIIDNMSNRITSVSNSMSSSSSAGGSTSTVFTVVAPNISPPLIEATTINIQSLFTNIKELYSGFPVVLCASIPQGGAFFLLKKTALELLAPGVMRPDFLVSIISSSLGTMGYWSFRTPAEIVKTQVQTGQCKSVIESLDAIKKDNNNNLKVLWKHYPVMLTLDIPFQVLNFILYGLASDAVLQAGFEPSTWTRLFCGVICGMFCAGVTCPIDVCKTRIIARDKENIQKMKLFLGSKVVNTTLITDGMNSASSSSNNMDDVNDNNNSYDNDGNNRIMMTSDTSEDEANVLEKIKLRNKKSGEISVVNTAMSSYISASSSSSDFATVDTNIDTSSDGNPNINSFTLTDDDNINNNYCNNNNSNTNTVGIFYTTSIPTSTSSSSSSIISDDPNLPFKLPPVLNTNADVWTEMQKIVSEEGFATLFLGLRPRLIYTGLANGIRLAAYGTSRMDLMMRSLDDL